MKRMTMMLLAAAAVAVPCSGAFAQKMGGTLHITHHRGLLGARVLTDITD